jgi:hypothetical protein
MNWLIEAATDSTTKAVSSKRVAMLTATFSLALSTIALSIAAVMGREVAAALAAVSVPLAGLGGYSYVGAKSIEKKAE